MPCGVKLYGCNSGRCGVWAVNEQNFVWVDVKEKSYLGRKKVDNREKCRGSRIGKLKTMMINKIKKGRWREEERSSV